MTLIQYMISAGSSFFVTIEMSEAGDKRVLMCMTQTEWKNLKRDPDYFRPSSYIGSDAIIEMSESDIYNFMEMRHRYFDRTRSNNPDIDGAVYELKGRDYYDETKRTTSR